MAVTINAPIQFVENSFVANVTLLTQQVLGIMYIVQNAPWFSTFQPTFSKFTCLDDFSAKFP